MLTFVTTAKAFTGHSGIIQRNALESWKRLHPDVEAILFGDEDGAAEVCAELGLRHEPHVERHESGFKYLSYMLEEAQAVARHQHVCYINCDIILLEDFWQAFLKTREWSADFLLVSRRWDTDITEPIDFAREDWRGEVRRKAMSEGKQQDPRFVDFFVFRRGFYKGVPKMVVGRSYWDWWMVAQALANGAPVVDGSRRVAPVHQNHGYGYHPQGKKGTNVDALAMRNLKLAGGARSKRWIIDSTHRMTRDGEIRRNIFPARLTWNVRNWIWTMATVEIPKAAIYKVWLPMWHFALDVTRPVRSPLGWRSQAVREKGKR